MIFFLFSFITFYLVKCYLVHSSGADVWHTHVQVRGQLVRVGVQFSSIYHIDLRGQTQVTELGSKSLFPPSHLTSPKPCDLNPRCSVALHSEDSNLGVEGRTFQRVGSVLTLTTSALCHSYG